jgi:CubicO group peptidase (beta-lactamase class C family)
MLRAALAVFAVISCLTTPATATADRPPPVDAAAIAREVRSRTKVPALVCVVVTKDGVHAIGADGVRRAGGAAAVTIDDRMHLGSCTKAFTAALAAVFVAEGALRWDTTVGETVALSLPDIDPAWRAVTLEQLLRHRGGVPTAPDPKAWAAAFGCGDSPKACRIAFVEATLAKSPVGTGTFAYSNQGYAIAGRMIEIVAGDTKGYETLLAERVLAPLGITRFGFGVPTRTEAASPVGHTEQGAPREIDNPNAIAPAGTLHMPLGEWAKFVAFHLGAKAPAALEGAARELPKLHERAKDAPFEALGWLSATRPWGGAVLTHAGSNTLWYCVAWLAPEKGFAVLAATNQGGDTATKACDDACAVMIQAMIKVTVKPAVDAKAAAPASAKTDAPRK